MKILFTRFPLESRHGGAEVQTLSLMRGLMKRGHHIMFLGGCPTLLTLCRERNIPCTELEIGPPPVTKWGAISFLWRRRGMRRKLRETFESFKDCNAVCMLSLSEKILLTPVVLEANAKVLWIEHDTVGRWLQKNPWLPRLLRLSRNITTVVVSNLSRDLYVEMGWDPARVVAIPNGIDVENFPSVAKIRSPSSQGIERFSIGTVARLGPEKGVDLLIRAAALISNVHLTIVGTGPQRKKLQALIEKFQLGDRIAIKPHISDLVSFYHSLDCFVLPSRSHDPFGLVAAEAMACGIATIVTDQCGIAGELRNYGDALIVQAGSSDALATAIATLKKNSRLRQRIAEAGARTAREAFTVDRMVERYEEVLRIPDP